MYNIVQLHMHIAQAQAHMCSPRHTQPRSLLQHHHLVQQLSPRHERHTTVVHTQAVGHEVTNLRDKHTVCECMPCVTASEQSGTHTGTHARMHAHKQTHMHLHTRSHTHIHTKTCSHPHPPTHPHTPSPPACRAHPGQSAPRTKPSKLRR